MLYSEGINICVTTVEFIVTICIQMYYVVFQNSIRGYNVFPFVKTGLNCYCCTSSVGHCVVFSNN